MRVSAGPTTRTRCWVRAALVAALLAAPGCGTLVDLYDGFAVGGQRRVFGGVRLALECSWALARGDPAAFALGGPYALFAPLDLPLSLVADLLALPATTLAALQEPLAEAAQTRRLSHPGPERGARRAGRRRSPPPR